MRDNPLATKEKETATTPQSNPLTNQPIVQPPLSTVAFSPTNLGKILQAIESPFSHDSNKPFRQTNIKLNRLERM